jgi:hypothetical protein
MKISTPKQTVESLLIQNTMLQKTISRLEKQNGVQNTKIGKLKAKLMDKEKHFLFHLRCADKEVRELSDQVKKGCKCSSSQSSP